MAPQPAPKPDLTIAVLSGFVLLFSVATCVAAVLAPANEKLFTLLAPQVTLFSGALLLWLKPKT